MVVGTVSLNELERVSIPSIETLKMHSEAHNYVNIVLLPQVDTFTLL